MAACFAEAAEADIVDYLDGATAVRFIISDLLVDPEVP